MKSAPLELSSSGGHRHQFCRSRDSRFIWMPLQQTLWSPLESYDVNLGQKNGPCSLAVDAINKRLASLNDQT